MNTELIYVVVWGTKQACQNFFNSPELDVEGNLVRQILEDIRSLIKYQSVELNFYSVTWAKAFEIYTAYTSVYDWHGRKNGYVAVSLFVPVGKRIVGGPVALLDRLMGMYRDQYIGPDWKIKQVKEDAAPFLQAVESAWVKEETRPVRTSKSTKNGVIRYAPGVAGKYLDNPYREEFDGYERVFFLPEGQSRLSTASTVQPIKLLGYGTEMARPVTYPVNIKPKLTRSKTSDARGIIVQINGVTVKPDQNGVFSREFSEEVEQVSVMVASDGYLPVLETRTVAEWSSKGGELKLMPVRTGAPRPNKKNVEKEGSKERKRLPLVESVKRDKEARPEKEQRQKKMHLATPQNSRVWSKTNQPINGTFSVEIFLKDNETKGAASVHSAPVRLNITSLGGAFYSSSSVVRLSGLKENDRLEGTIEVEGYRTKVFSYTVRPKAGSVVSVLEPKTVFLDRQKGPSVMTGAAGTETRNTQENYKKERKPEKPVGLANWMKVVIAVMVCALTYLAYDFFTKPDGGIKEEDRRELLAEFETRYYEKQEEVAKLSDQHLSMLRFFDEKVDEAKDAGIRRTLIDSARNAYQESLSYFEVSDKLLEPTKDIMQYMVDTSKVKLPAISRLDSLLDTPFVTFKSRKGRDTKVVSDFKIQLENALDDKSTVEKEAERREKELKENGRIATQVANDSNLFSVRFYSKYIEWCTRGPSNNTAFNSSRERQEIVSKLELMKLIANLDYLARTDFNEALRSISELKELKKDARLTSAQAKMVQKKIDFAVANPPG